MALRDRKYQVKFSSGLDTEANEREVLPGSLTDAQNVRFRERVTLVKRYGNELLTTRRTGLNYLHVSGCLGLASRDNQEDLVMLASSDEVLSYVSGEGWRPAGPWVLLEQDTLAVPRGPYEAWDGTTTSTGSVRYLAWHDSRGGVLQRAVTVSDDGGVRSLSDEYRVGGDRGYLPRSVMVGGRPHTYFISGSTLNVGIVNPADPTSTTVTQVQVAADLTDPNPSGTNQPYDVRPVGTNALIGWKSQTGIQLGMVGAPGIIAGAGLVGTIMVSPTASSGPAMAVSPDGRQVAVVFTSGSAGGPVYRCYSTSDLSLQVGTTALDLDTDVTGSGVRRLTCAYDPAYPTGSYRLQVVAEVSASDPTRRRIKSYQATVGGTVTSGVLRHSRVASRPFALGSHNYVWVHTPYVDQSTDHLIRLPDNLTVARSRYSTAYPDVSGGISDVDVVVGPTGGPKALRLGGCRDSVPLPGTSGSTFSGRHVRLITTEYQPSSSWRPVDVDGVLHMNGGWPGTYDGDRVTEMGFTFLVEGLSASLGSGSSPAGGGILDARDLGTSGPLASASFVYVVLPYSTDARGNRIVGGGNALGVVLTASLGSVQNSASLSWDSMVHTMRDGTHGPNIQYMVCRTGFVGGVPGTTLQRIDDPSHPIVNDTGSDRVTFVDTFSQAVQSVGEVAYINFEDTNVMPPAHRSAVATGDRLYLAGLEGLPNTVLASKLRLGGAIRFEDAGTIPVDSDGGPIRALAPIDGNISVFKRDRIFAMAAAGPDNTSTDTTPFPDPVLITSEVGVQRHPVTVQVAGETVQGLMFKSDRGIRLQNRGGVVQNKGWQVVDFNGRTVVAAVAHRTAEEVRFYTSEGDTLVLDTRFDMWARDPNQRAVAACSWQGRPTFARNDGRVWAEDTGSYLDGSAAYPMLVETGWLPLQDVQGIVNVKDVTLIGDYVSPHLLRFETAYGYRDTWYARVWDPTGSLIVQPYGGGTSGSTPAVATASFGGFGTLGAGPSILVASVTGTAGDGRWLIMSASDSESYLEVGSTGTFGYVPTVTTAGGLRYALAHSGTLFRVEVNGVASDALLSSGDAGTTGPTTGGLDYIAGTYGGERYGGLDPVYQPTFNIKDRRTQTVRFRISDSAAQGASLKLGRFDVRLSVETNRVLQPVRKRR